MVKGPSSWIAEKPTERPAPPIQPGPKDADIIWRYDMMDELGRVFPHNASELFCVGSGWTLFTSCTSKRPGIGPIPTFPSPNAPSFNSALDTRKPAS